jgi:hypothetical protein
MILPETVQPTESDTEAATPFSVQYTAALLVNSFRFSQGNSRFQGPILEYLATRFHDQFDEQVISEARDPASRTVYKIINNKSQHNPHIRFDNPNADTNPNAKNRYAAVRKVVRVYARNLLGHLEEDPAILAEEAEDSAQYLATETIERDSYFLGLTMHKGQPERRSQRRLREQGRLATPFNDPYFSFWVYHGLMQQTTGFKEYDAMFEEMVAAFEDTYSFGSSYRQKSDALEAHYAEHHPVQVD